MMNDKLAEAYLAAITETFGPERPKRWKPALKILQKYIHPEALLSPGEFADVFAHEYDIAGKPLLKSNQFAFYIAAYINSNWYTGRVVNSLWRDDGVAACVPEVLELTYTGLMYGADGTLAEGKVFDLDVLEASIIVRDRGLSGTWTWYVAEVSDVEPVILAANIGVPLARVVEAKLGQTPLAPSPGDVYLLDEMEVPFSYYEALRERLHISDIVKLYIQDIPLEYALVMNEV